MITSRDRILVTHVGSLPRNDELSDLLVRQEEGNVLDPHLLAHAMDPFPELVDVLMRRFPKRSRMQNAPEAQSEIHYLGTAAVSEEIARLKNAVQTTGVFRECFMTAPSPGIVSTTMLNHYYDSHEAYLMALAAQLRQEYLEIHRAGFLLQIDSPDLAMDRAMFYRDLSDREFVAAIERHVAAINKALEGIPRDRVRLHCCWGNWDGPHIFDVPLDLILPVLYQANVGALSIEFANPRHQHEYGALARHRLPDHMVLMPGCVETTSNIVEHPQVVARRIEEAVAAVGDRERVIASTDCGFSTFTGREWVIEPAVWLKLKSLREGAEIASAHLWRHA
jgi:5-methyltetrahydropteroyltriglutamate--homocysteine methyltransferase